MLIHILDILELYVMLRYSTLEAVKEGRYFYIRSMLDTLSFNTSSNHRSNAWMACNE